MHSVPPCFLVLLLLSGVTGSMEATAMAFPADDWQPIAPRAQAIDSERLRAAVDYLSDRLKASGGAETLVIIRDGLLIWAGPQCDAQHQIYSATKSFTSTCLGLLIDDGVVSLDTRACELVPSLAEQYPEATLRHFATMTSGYDAAGCDYEPDAEGRGDSWKPDPPASPLFEPGSRFRYWDEAMMQFASALVVAAGGPLDALFRKRIAEPIGMEHWSWDAGSWTGGIHTSSRELARFGHLFLNRGRWGDGRLVSAEWVDQATAVQVPPTIPNDDLPRSRGSGVYGYNWWVNGTKPDGQLMWPDVPEGAYYANGLHNNVCIVVPAWHLVIARTNGPCEPVDPADMDETWNGFLARVGKALGTEHR